MLQDLKPAHQAALDAGEEYEEETAPWVIDREFFKTDYVGYLDRRRTHVYVFDLDSKQLAQLTHGDFDAESPAWSPDGTRIAFASNRTADADLNYNSDIWVVPAAPVADGFAELLQVTSHPGTEGAPSWSADGQPDRPHRHHPTRHGRVRHPAPGGFQCSRRRLAAAHRRTGPDGIWPPVRRAAI